MKLNMAQRILLACGMDRFKLLLGAANRGRAPQQTKSGPARRHADVEARRKDKLRETTEQYTDDEGRTKIRTAYVPFLLDESKLERAARHQKIGVRHA